MKKFYFALAFLFMGLFVFGQTASTEVGITEGELSVSLSGAANYTVPIAVPPGINGVEPQISLNYNSQRGLSGNVAPGWDIMGASKITRIPSTKFHDGLIDPVDFDALDRFALDGERLIVKNGSNLAYGAHGTVYETENFSNLKITSYGVHPSGANYGPAYFLIEYPDGSKAYYGNSADSVSVSDWAITYSENPQGVRISYNYTLSKNILYLTSVKYGSLGTATSINEIQFVYGSRYSVENGYVGGVNTVRDKNLSSIHVIGNGVGYRNYILASGWWKLESITEKSGDNTKSYNPIVFNYGLNSSETVKYSPVNSYVDVGEINSLNAATISGDFNADGSADFILYPTIGPQAKKVFWLYYDLQSGANLNMGYKVETGAFDDIFPTTGLSWNNKVLAQGWTVVQTDAFTEITKFRPFSLCGTNIICPQEVKEYTFPKFTHKYFYTCDYDGPIELQRVGTSKSTGASLASRNPVMMEGNVERDAPKSYISGDFNGDGLTDIIAIEKPISYFIYKDCSTTIPQSYAGGKSYFINLDKRLTSDFVKESGFLSVTSNSKYFVGDFNGDGKSDLYVFDLYYVKVYSLDASGNLVLIYQNTTADSVIDLNKPILLGDYNGDGKSDFMIPKALDTSTWFKYTSTGISQIKEEKSSSVVFSSNDSYNTYNFVPANINNDGRTDLVRIISFKNPRYSTGIITVECFRNIGGDFNVTPDRASTGDQEGINIYALPMYLPQTNFSSNNGLSTSQPTLEIAFANKNKLYFFNSRDDEMEDNILRKITTGNGVEEIVSYTPLSSVYENLYYPVFAPSTGISNYPDLDITIDPNFRLVSKIEKKSKETYKKRLFFYYGAVSNLEGLGFKGFRSLSQTNWFEDESKMITSILKFDLDQRGAKTESYNVLGFHAPLYAPANPVSRIITKGENYTVTGQESLVATQRIILKPGVKIEHGSTFSAIINPEANRSVNTPTDFITRSVLTYESELLPNKVFKLQNTVLNEDNNLYGTNVRTVNTYDVNENITNSIRVSKEGSSAAQTVTTDIGYQLPITSPYIVGRPVSKSQSVSVPGHTMTSREVYTYNGNQLLLNVDKSASGTATISEKNDYDNFGNITKKTVTAPLPLQPRVTDYEYDSSGRFLTKITNSDRLSTSFVYYPDGTLKSETSPFASTSYIYDSWFKRLAAKDEKLNKTISTTYTKNAEKTIITTTDASEGSVTEEVFDDLGRKVKVGVKNINGAFSYVSFLYDIYDRNYKTSEPYFGGLPSQWNEVKFDVYGRETENIMFTNRTTLKNYVGLTSTFTDGQRSKAFTSNAVGTVKNVNETTGGDINYSYFADGSLKQTSYNGVNITMEQDGWGRKTKLIDPSAGTFVYNNNDFGELTSEISQNGNVVTSIKRDDYGKVIEKRIVGLETKSIANYTYDSTTQLPLTIDYVDEKEPAGINRTLTTIAYDDLFKRVNSITEEKFNVTKFIKLFSYDNLGRIDTETKIAKIGNKESKVVTKYVYKNGYLYQILDDANNKVLWQVNEVNAKGQIVENVLGNGIKMINEYNTDGYLFKIKYDKTTNPVQNILTLTTMFDKYTDNLDSRINSAFGNYTETFKYDEIDRLKKFTNRLGIEETQNYDPSGKITNNSVGVYSYDDKNKPYQNNAITLTNEAAAYYSGREGVAGTSERKLIVTYNAFKSPVQIEETGIDKISFTYNDNNQRSTMYYGSLDDKLLRPWRKHYSVDGTMEIKENIVTGAIEFVTYIGGDGYTAPIVAKSNGGNGLSYLYLHRDYQGTILAITDANATVVEKRLFDAWGSIIKVQDGAGNTLSSLTALDRGYTGHEHLQSVGLINMNARLYDPMLHRFLQVDNYIQDPTSTQNYNQYGYVLNNPLLYTDPSGNVTQGPGKDCIDCGPSPTQQTFIGNAVKGLVDNWDSLGIKDWLNKNINGDNISQWWKSKISLKNIFGGSKNSGPPPNMSSYANIQMPTQHSSLGFNWTYLSQGAPGERFIYEVGNTVNIAGQVLMGRSVADGSMRNLDTSSTTTDQGVSALVDIATSMFGGGGARIALSEMKATQIAMKAKNVINVTRNGVALPKGAYIPKIFIENPWRAGDYGEIINGSFKSRVRIDQATKAGFKGPNINHFHLNNGRRHIFDMREWPWWNN